MCTEKQDLSKKHNLKLPCLLQSRESMGKWARSLAPMCLSFSQNASFCPAPPYRDNLRGTTLVWKSNRWLPPSGTPAITPHALLPAAVTTASPSLCHLGPLYAVHSPGTKGGALLWPIRNLGATRPRGQPSLHRRHRPLSHCSLGFPAGAPLLAGGKLGVKDRRLPCVGVSLHTRAHACGVCVSVAACSQRKFFSIF